jgi:alkylation response protein AidB-like acyl-CoA dehydrogenase
MTMAIEAPTSLARSAQSLADHFLTLLPDSDEDTFPAEEFQLLAAAGLLAAPAGGLTRDLQALLRVLKEMGRGNLAVGRIYEGHVNALQLIQAFGTGEQIARWSADARAGHLFAVWNTEADDGVSLTALSEGVRLAGAKTFASGAGHVTRPIVTGRLPDGGWQMCVVPLESARVASDPSWWQPLGMRASVSYKLDFTGVVVAPDDLLGASGDYHRQPWFSAGALRFAAVQLGGAEALLDASRAALRALGRTEDPYQRQRIGEAAILIESGNQWLKAAAERVDLSPAAGADSATTLGYANMTRTAIETICLEIIRIVERSVGVRGLLRPSPIERILRDLTMYLRQPAPDAALAQVGQVALESPAAIGRLWDDAS